MSQFMSLSPAGLPQLDDAELCNDKPTISVDEREDGIDISFLFPGFVAGNADQRLNGQNVAFKEVGIAGAGFLSESGKPLLPSFGRFVQIPAGCSYAVSMTKSEPVIFENILITPAQEQATDQAGAITEFEYDNQAYRDDALYPAKIFEVSQAQQLDDYRVLLIQVRPLQYNPAKQQLHGYGNIQLTIDLVANEKDGPMNDDDLATADPSTSREGFGNLLLNPRRNIAERVIVGRRPPTITLRPQGPEYLIIYDAQLEAAAVRLAQWKNRKGIITETLSIDTVGNSAAAIKNYIRDRRRSIMARMRYVLLFGDVSAIASEERSNNTTDHYYFTKNDYTGNSDCVLPWVSGGRIPVNSLNEANAVVDQIIDYERQPPCDPNYYRRMTFAAYFQDDTQDGRANRAYMKTLEGIREHMVSIGFDVERVYVSNAANPQHYKDGTAVPEDVKNAIVSGSEATAMLISETSEGQILLAHRDHGNEAGWSHPSFNIDHLQSIRSASPSIFFSINCLTGCFDNNPSQCFAEAILALDGGAPSLIAATELSGTWRNDSLMKGLFDGLWPGVISGFPNSTASYALKHNRLGDILNYAKSYLLVAHGSTEGVRDHFEIYHIIGDPSLQLWAEPPAPLQLKTFVRRNILNISITPAPSEGVITIWNRGKMLRRVNISSTRISIPVTDLKRMTAGLPISRNKIEVCVSAPGYRHTATRVNI